MPDTIDDEDPRSFFSRLRRDLGIDFEEDGPPAPSEDAREVAAEPPSPEPPPILDVERLPVDTYPGSTQKLNPQREVDTNPVPEDETPWDLHPRVYTSGGKETEFFPISSLAIALRRKPGTIRKWESQGFIPPAQFRSPGAQQKQDRLYTRDQIEGLQKIAREENLMDPAKKMRIDQTGFRDRAHRLFRVLAGEKS